MGDARKMSYDDYYCCDAFLIAIQSHLVAGRSLDTVAKCGFKSFQTMIRVDPLTSEGLEEASFLHPASLNLESPGYLKSSCLISTNQKTTDVSIDFACLSMFTTMLQVWPGAACYSQGHATEILSGLTKCFR